MEQSLLNVEIENGYMTNGIGCLVVLKCPKLKNLSFLCPSECVLHPISTRMPEANRGTVKLSIWLKSSLETQDSNLIELTSCCAKCGENPLALRCKSFTFSESGKASLPITFKCSPLHSGRPKESSLVLKIEFPYKSKSIKGSTVLPFKRLKKKGKVDFLSSECSSAESDEESEEYDTLNLETLVSVCYSAKKNLSKLKARKQKLHLSEKGLPHFESLKRKFGTISNTHTQDIENNDDINNDQDQNEHQYPRISHQHREEGDF